MTDLKDFVETVHFACLKHRDQRRKNPYKSPYINHPVEVAHILADNGVEDVKILQAALLHDVLEDTSCTYEELVEHFGTEVADIVREVTDDKTTTKYERKKAQLDLTCKKSIGARLVKIGDKISNTKDLKDTPPEGWTELQCLGYIHWSFAICLSVIEAGDISEKLQCCVWKHFESLGFDSVDEEVLTQYFESL